MTTGSLSDSDVQLLASKAKEIQAEVVATRRSSWEGSPFGWLKQGPSSRQKGKIAEQLVESFFASKGFVVEKSPDSEADRIINGLRTEIKASTLWQNGTYRFQQLRDQNYAVAICLGISPFDAHCWAIPKSVIIDNPSRLEGLRPQHRGSEGRDTAWLKVDPKKVQSWLLPFGGTLGEAVQVLGDLSRSG